MPDERRGFPKQSVHLTLALVAARLASPERPLAMEPAPAAGLLEELPAFLRANKLPILSFPSGPGRAAWLDAAPLAEARRREAESFAGQRAESALVRQEWEAAGIQPIFIKAAGLPPSFPHTSDNLDVYISPGTGDAARQALRRLGYVELRNIEEPNKYLFKRFRAGQEVCAIHVHERIEWSVSFLFEEQVWARRRVAPDDPRLQIPGPEDALLITIAHSLYENKCIKLGDLARVNHCLRHYALDWDYIWETARSKGWGAGLAFSLLLYDRLDRRLFVGPAMPAEQLERAWEWLRGGRRRRAEAYLGRPASFPFPIGFGFSKLLFFEKILRDENEPPAARLRDAGVHLVTGAKLRLRLHSQPKMLVSISGVDGAGKSTQARALRSAFQTCAIRTRTVWARGGASSLAAGLIGLGRRLIGAGDDARAGRGADEEARRAALFRRPIARRGWPWLILIDLTWAYLRRVRWPLLRGRVVICDRYVADALAEMGGRLGEARVMQRLPCRLLRRLNPRPHLAWYLEVAPAAARARQPAEVQQGTPQLAERQITVYNRLLEAGELRRVDGSLPPEEIGDRLVYETLTDYFDRYWTLANALLLSNPKPCSAGGTRAAELPPRPAPMPFVAPESAPEEAERE